MTTRLTERQLSFSSGELSPLLHARADYQRFQTGAAAMPGFLPLRQGGFTRAPGTLYRGNTDSDAPARLIPFEFAEDDALILELTNGKMRVWRYGALVMDGGTPFELVMPYDDAAIARLNWVQSADVIYLADGAQPIQKLSRFALDNWSIGPADFDSGPFRVQNLDEALTLQASAETGTVTLTASADLFEANHVGSLMRLTAVDYTNIPIWTGNTTVAVNDQLRAGKNIYRVVSGTNTGANQPVHTEGTVQTDKNTGIQLEHVSDGAGIVRITSITSPTSAEVDVLKRLPKAVVDDPTYRFAEGAWSARHGYPLALELFDQRLVAAATASDPRTVWFSTGGAFEDFEPGIEADSSFAYAIAGQSSLNRILWLKAGPKSLHIGALGEEYSTRSTDGDAIIGPTTARFGRDSGIGSRPIRPIAPDGWPIFVSKDGARIFEIRYSFEADTNQAQELSLPSDHLGADGFDEIVWQGAPLRLAWARRGNGELAAMVHEPSEDVLGWAPYPVAGGVVESLAVTPNAEATADVLTMIVRREVDGQTRRFVEEQAVTYGTLFGSQPVSEAVHLFSAVQLTADPATDTFSVPHLASREVFAWTDEGNSGPHTVAADGSVTLEVAVTSAVIGLFDERHRTRSLPFQPRARDGAAMGRRHRVHAKLGVHLHRTVAGKVRAISRETDQSERVFAANELVRRPVGEPPATAVTGVVTAEIGGATGNEVMVEYLPVGGAPMTVLAHAPTLEEHGA